MNPQERLAKIKQDIAGFQQKIEALHDAREEARAPILPDAGAADAFALAAGMQPRQFKLVAQGDSWFDYLPGKDIIDYLRGKYGHDIENLAVGGSTLNDIVYGPVPENFLGIPQSDAVDRMAELVAAIEHERPNGLILSGGGNDVAGMEFFSFVNNARSGLSNPNAAVLSGALNQTFKTAYEQLIEIALLTAEQAGIPMKVFAHGYDYPFPDGRGVTIFNVVGPWFDETFDKKNYPYEDGNVEQLQERFDIVKVFIDAFNTMLKDFETKYPGKFFHVNLRGQLTARDQWANELHPTNDGFKKLAVEFDRVLQANL